MSDEVESGKRKRRPRRAYVSLTSFLFFAALATLLILFADEIVEHTYVFDRAFVYILAFVSGIVATFCLLNGLLTIAGGGALARFALNLLAVAGLVAVLYFAFGTGGLFGWRLQFTGSMVPSLRPLPRLGELPGIGGDNIDGDGNGAPAGGQVALADPPEWPGFLGPERDAATSDPGLATDWNASPPERLWSRSVGEGWSSFAVASPYFFTQEQRGASEYVAAYRLADGEPVWAVARETRHDDAIGGVGPRATPTLADGRLYAAGATGEVVCLDPATGAGVWSATLRDFVGVTASQETAEVAWGRAASPLVRDRRVYLPGGGSKFAGYQALVAFDAETGLPLWRSGDEQIAYVSPTWAVIDDVPQVIHVGEQTIAGYAPDDGTILWSHPWPGQSAGQATCTQPHILSRNRVLISKGYGYGALLLRVGKLEGSDEWVAEPLWENHRVLGTKFTNLVTLGEYAYGLSDGILECVALEDGRRVWRDGRYGHGQILLVGELLIVQAEQGEIVLVEPTPEELRELGRFQALEGKTWNHPVLVGDVLLVRNSDEMAAWRLPLRASSPDAATGAEAPVEPGT